jgi:chemotaxis protein methyltransferase CheR
MPPAATDALDPFLHWLLARAGLNPVAYRSKALQRRLPACLRGCRVTSTGEAQKLLEGDAQLLSATLDRALIGVTAFFRDPKVFATLHDTIFPELLRAKAGLRVCSAGAGDGQELISVAVLLAELGALEKSQLEGIDCRPGAISRAQAGLYDDTALASLPAELRERYFISVAGHWKVRSDIQRVLRWSVGDVSTFRERQLFDVILFRNVAIYLRCEAAVQAWTNLSAQLAPGGFMVTTTAEKPPAGLRLERVAPAVYRRQ